MVHGKENSYFQHQIRTASNERAARTALAADMVLRKKYTFVTIVYEAEYALLLVQARSMRIYCPIELIEAIIVIDNSETALRPNWKHKLMVAYGELANFVRFVGAREIAQVPQGTGGYWTQQLLKLMVSLIIESERYVILDAKTHLVFTLTRDFLEAPDGRARIHVHSYIDHILCSDLERVLAYLEMDSTLFIHRFMTCVTPFVMYTNIVRELMDYLIAREAAPFEYIFIKNQLWEFFLYGGYIIRRGGDVNDLYCLDQVRSPAIWDHYTKDECIREVEIAATNKTLTPFFSLHRRAIVRLSAHSRRTIADFWCGRMLFKSTNSADRFLIMFQIVSISGALRRRIARRVSKHD